METMKFNDTEFVTDKTAREVLGKSQNFLYRMRQDGKLPKYKIGRTNLTKVSDLLNLIETTNK